MSAGQGRKGDVAVLCAHLASGATLQDAALAARMSERTARRRLQDPDVIETLARLRDARTDAVTAELVSVGREAVAVLRELMYTTHSVHARVRAATTILTLSVRYQEHTTERRLAMLEEQRLEQDRLAAQVNSMFGEH